MIFTSQIQESVAQRAGRGRPQGLRGGAGRGGHHRQRHPHHPHQEQGGRAAARREELRLRRERRAPGQARADILLSETRPAQEVEEDEGVYFYYIFF